MPNTFVHPLKDWQHEHMSMELSVLHGEMFRTYCFIESLLNAANQITYAERISTMVDRMYNANMVIALATLPKLEEIVRFFHDEGEGGVFVYQHIEIQDRADWRNDKGLASELWRECLECHWFDAAENNKVDIDELNYIIEEWAKKNVVGYEHWMKFNDHDTMVVQHKGGVTYHGPVSDDRYELQFQGGALYQWDADQVYCQEWKEGEVVWEHMNYQKLEVPTPDDLELLILHWTGARPAPSEPRAASEQWLADDLLTRDQLVEKYSPDDSDGEHPDWPQQLWRKQVDDCETCTGYWDWVHHQVTSEPDTAYPPSQLNKHLLTHYSKDKNRNVSLTQVEPGSFEVRYGALVRTGLTDIPAGRQYGEWVFHSITCDGLVELG